MGHKIEKIADDNGDLEDGFSPITWSSSSISNSISIDGKCGEVYLSLDCFERIRDELAKRGAIFS